MSNAPFHRLWQGKAEDRLAVLPADSVDLVLTDPPFGSDNHSNMSTTGEGQTFARKIENDETFEQAEATFKSVMDVLLPKTKEHSDLYVFCNDAVLMEWLQLMRGWVEKTHGFKFTRTLIWRKGSEKGAMTPGIGDLATWGSGVEFILYAKKGRKPMYGDRRGAVIDCPKLPSAKIIHPHEKPLKLLTDLIQFSTEPGELVVDPFGGSYATARASRATDRSCVSTEYDEYNHKLAMEKWRNTGDQLL
jgi:site-specific DNA-methyltransferase (adenine-specific)